MVELAEQLTDHVPITVEPEHSPDQICALAARHSAAAFGVPLEAVLSRDRHRPITDARAVAQAVSRTCGLTLPAIGSYFGQHHATVMHSIGKVTSTLRLAAAAAQITERLHAAPDVDQAA